MLINIIKIPTWPILTKRKFPAKQKQKNTWLELERRWSKILLEIKTSSPHKKRVTPFSLADKERTWRRNIPAAAIPEITLNEFRRSSDVVSGMELVKSLTFLSLSGREKKLVIDRAIFQERTLTISIVIWNVGHVIRSLRRTFPSQLRMDTVTSTINSINSFEDRGRKTGTKCGKLFSIIYRRKNLKNHGVATVLSAIR